MNIVAVTCNVLYWAFFCLVLVTDGPPNGADVPLALVAFLMPVFNVVVLRVLSSSSRAMTLAALAGNIVWLGLACWRIAVEYPSHPKEAGLLPYAVLLALTPLVSALALCLKPRAREHALPA